MLTVLIHHAEDPAALAQTLSPLVSGAVEGIVREVVVLGAENEEVRRVADHAGCRLADAAPTLADAAALRGEWILAVRAGARLPDDWIDKVVRHASGGAASGGAARLPDPGDGVFARVFGRSRGAVLVPRAALAVAARRPGGADVEALLRALRPRPMARAR